MIGLAAFAARFPRLGSRDPCDCCDPDCELPHGRCVCCGTPCDADNGGNEVCHRRQCAGRVLRLYKLQVKIEALRDNPDGPPWAPFNERPDGSWEIQRLGTGEGMGPDGHHFLHDDSATDYVLAHLGAARAT